MPDFDPDPNLPGYTYLRLADYLTAQIHAGRAMVVPRERGLVATWPSKGSFVSDATEPPAAAGAGNHSGDGDDLP